MESKRLQLLIRLLPPLLLGTALLAGCESGGDDPSLATPNPPAPQPVSATLAWTAASGPVVGYQVFESLNGGPIVEGDQVSGTSVTVTALPGDTMRIQVAGFDAQGNRGPVSAVSDVLSFGQTGVTAGAATPAAASVAGAEVGGLASAASVAAAATASPSDGSAVSASEPADVPDGSSPDGGSGEETQAAVRLDVSGDGAADLLWESVTQGLLRVTSLDLALLAVFERPASDWALVGLADLDGDGLTDLLWARDSGELAMTRMAPSLAGSPDFIDAGALGSDEVVLATGDFDGDGSAELLVESSGNGRLAIWNLTAGGAPDARELELLPGVGQVLAGSRDYDADGIDDLLFQGPDGSLTAWLLDGDGVRALAPLGATPGGDVLASGDFDGDGVIDVARLDAAGAAQLLLLGGGLDTPTAVGVLPPVAGLEWAGVGDYDGDGRSDLLWQDAGGSPVVWFIDPDLTAETVTLPVEPDWALVADWR